MRNKFQRQKYQSRGSCSNLSDKRYNYSGDSGTERTNLRDILRLGLATHKMWRGLELRDEESSRDFEVRDLKHQKHNCPKLTCFTRVKNKKTNCILR